MSRPWLSKRIPKVMMRLSIFTFLVTGFQNCSPFQSSNFAAQENASSDSTASIPGVGGPGWHTLKVGAGGFLRGLDIASDGTKVVKADTYGAFIWNQADNEWKQLITFYSMPSDDREPGSHGGVLEIRIAPSLTSRLYMEHNGYVYRSDNSGTTWQRTTFAKVPMNANGPFAQYGFKMAVDPINPDVVYVGTEANGLFVTFDGGTTFSQVAMLPRALKKNNNDFGVTGLTFDPASGSSSGRTNRIYASSFGNGVYTSANAGATWSRTVGGPNSVEHAVASSDGAFYVLDADDGATNFWRYKNQTWANISPQGGGYHTVAIDPSRPERIILATGGTVLNESIDGGATWTGNWWPAYNPSSMGIKVAIDMPALAKTAGSWMTNGDMQFDPITHDLYMSEGTGVWKTILADTMGGYTWVSQSAGIEQLVSNQILVPPGGAPIVASWDRATHYLSDLSKYPESYGPNNSFAAGWGIDYASSNPKFIAGVFNFFGTDQSGYSTDGGKTWQQFATKPSPVAAGAQGGCIAASTPQNIVFSPSNNSIPSYTKDGGKTWTQVSIPGQSGNDGYGWAYYLKRQIVAADRVTPNTFYLYSYKQGLFTSTDGGSSWSLARAGEIGNWTSFNAKLKSVPGKAGHLFFTAGPQTGATHPTGTLFYRSTDAGKSFTAVPGLGEVYDFAFGKAAPGANYPAIFIAGWYNNVWGIYRSDDNAATWASLGATPNSSLDGVAVIEGDPNVYGRVYVGFGGSGYAYFNLPAAD